MQLTKVFSKVLADGSNSAILLSFSNSFGNILVKHLPKHLFVVRKQHRPETLKKHLVNSQKSFKFVECDHGYILTHQYLGEFMMKNLKKYQSCFLKK